MSKATKSMPRLSKPYKITYIDSPNFSSGFEPFIKEEINMLMKNLDKPKTAIQFVVFEQLTKASRMGYALTSAKGLIGIGLNSKLKNLKEIVKTNLPADLKIKIQSLQ